jgi:hypothetical protein
MAFQTAIKSIGIRVAVGALSGAIILLSPLGIRFAASQSRTDPATLTIALDRATLIKLPEKVRTVIVGNPGIADISLQPNGVTIVTGKSFGVTNLMALDDAGALLAELDLHVAESSKSVLTVQRGLDRESYSCNPNCQPIMQLGDARAHFGQIGDQAERRNKQSAD